MPSKPRRSASRQRSIICRRRPGMAIRQRAGLSVMAGILPSSRPERSGVEGPFLYLRNLGCGKKVPPLRACGASVGTTGGALRGAGRALIPTAMTANLDAVIIGAGFAGMYMLHRLRGKGFSARVIEAGKGVGGTWYWNRYPGARCDVESVQYSYQFSPELEQEWEWTERYATQPEILKYANHVADRYDLRRDIQFETRVTKAEFVEGNSAWVVETDKGQRIVARFVITAMGCL